MRPNLFCVTCAELKMFCRYAVLRIEGHGILWLAHCDPVIADEITGVGIDLFDIHKTGE